MEGKSHCNFVYFNTIMVLHVIFNSFYIILLALRNMIAQFRLKFKNLFLNSLFLKQAFAQLPGFRIDNELVFD